MSVVILGLKRLSVPLALTALAATLSLLLLSLGPRVPFALFIGAVLVSAWWGGLRPALVATGVSLGLLAGLYAWQAPEGEGHEDYWLRLGMFTLVGLLGGYLSQQCRRAIGAVDHVHDLLAGSGLAVIAVDLQGHVTSLNSLARSLTGWGDAEATGVSAARIFQVLLGTETTPHAFDWKDVANGQPYTLPEGSRLAHPGGGTTPIEGSLAPVRVEGGPATGLVLTFRAAAERAQALDEVRRRSERYRALAGHAPAPLLLLNAEGQCVFANPAAQAACDCSAEECLGEGWARHVVAADRQRILAHWPAAVQARQPFAEELRVQGGPGLPRWFRLRASPVVSEGGELLGQVATLEDVSERKLSEEQVREERNLCEALLNALPEAIAVKDAHGRILRQNQTAKQLSESVSNIPWGETEEQAWESGQEQRGEYQTKHKGQAAWFEVAHLPVQGPTGDVVTLIEVVSDRTDTHALMSKIADLTREGRELRDLLETRERETASLQDEWATLSQNHETALQRLHEDLQTAQQKGQQERQLLEREIAQDREAARLAIEQLEQAEAEQTHLQEELKLRTQERDEAVAILEMTEEEIHTIRLEQVDWREEEANVRQERIQAQEDLLHVRSLLRQAEADLAEERRNNAPPPQTLTTEPPRAALEAELARLLGEQSRYEEELNSARQRQEILHHDLEEAHEARRTAEREQQRLRAEFASLEERIRHETALFTPRNQALEADVMRLEAERAQREEEHATVRARAEELRMALEEALQSRQQLESERHGLLGDLHQLRADKDQGGSLVGQLQQTLAETQAQLQRLEADHARDMSERESELSRLRDRLGDKERLFNEREQLARQHEESHRIAEAREEELRHLREVLRREQEQAEAARRQEEDLRRALTQARHQIHDGEMERAALDEKQRELCQERDFLEGVIESSPEGIFAHDRDGRCRVWNTALARLLNRDKKEALGRTAFELFPTEEGNDTGRRLRVDGRHEALASIHAPIRISNGEVLGGMALVRRLEVGAPSAPAPSEASPAVRIDSDWLGFN